MSTVLLRGGRVIDPATGADQIADVLIRDGKIAAIGKDLVAEGADVVDVAGKIVGPGFIDLHSHVNSIAGQRLQAMDGVTTALELEAGLLPVELAYQNAANEGRPINFGFSASWGMARAAVLSGWEPKADFAAGLSVLGDPAWQKDSSSTQLNDWLGLLEREISDGALGIGILQGYAPRTDPREYRAVNKLAATMGVPTFTHVREIVESDPSTPIDGTEEAAQVAMEFGGQVHHCHVNSTSRRHIDRTLGVIDRARAGGATMTVETYPYGAGSTGIGAAFLAPERLPAWDLKPSNLVIVSTGERIRDEAHLRHVRETDPGATCIVEYLDDSSERDRELLARSLAYPDSIVASDAMPVTWPNGSIETREWPLPPGGMTHPRTAGTFARSIRMMVREYGVWDWVEVYRRCSYLPARVMDSTTPAFEAKGHLGIGADADITVIDPTRVTDQANYVDGTKPSIGFDEVLVAGQFVVRGGDIVIDAYPGKGLRGHLR
ncbi:amidohydrolase family protein [Leucobacter sp. UT-8R-CII-1-4]|uniref:amidohydrolase family protein n=1 Tax=Leucobacter sp. UT-8R-CII-1-4 TaxID=3040075 RepID=UPI0024A97A47|nr:amidohydrolase family protein [Leucobacter sp. UT-8R-CII-1-4]MDI6022092.1 amidohydrolase family protein [Leucobacter sp. UT-8R-CII-1-4]